MRKMNLFVMKSGRVNSESERSVEFLFPKKRDKIPTIKGKGYRILKILFKVMFLKKTTLCSKKKHFRHEVSF